ncbi:uncharacterized protein PG986_000860 [Apiospora aurea]|uniref:Protein kinase domain-containing protein n=1 Tax=Apiospora aurea TaxID=335848 RepID=A0ABR1QVB2_9PEZI
MQYQSFDSSPEASPAPTREPSTAIADTSITSPLESNDTRPDLSQEIEESIHDKLWARRLPDCSDSAKKFIPLDAQEEIINAGSVRRELARKLKLGPAELDELVIFICPGKSDGDGSARGTKLFAVLGLIDRLDSIWEFKQEGISDCHLPFRRDGRNRLIPRNFWGSFGCFETWRSRTINEFEIYQWYTLTPFLQPRSLGLLDDGITLPWTQYSDVAEGGHSSVYKEGSTYFALKELKSKDPSIFDGECGSFRKLGQHRHLTELLTSFKHKGRYYLLFPWAYGGTLENLWETSQPKPAYACPRWVAQQAQGLVDGLFRVHHVKSNGVQKAIEAVLDNNQEEGDKIFGRHGDIKRDNVLVFLSEQRDEGGVLKLSDFGLTVFHSNMSRSTDRPGSTRPCGLTYRAPEAEANQPDNRLSPRYDIWCLGCLYLDMVTWLLLGPEGLDEFSDNRSREKGYLSSFNLDIFWKSKKGPRGSLGPPVVKTSVKYWIRYLQGLEDCTDYLPKDRKQCGEVLAKLNEMSKKQASDGDYLTKKTRRPTLGSILRARVFPKILFYN